MRGCRSRGRDDWPGGASVGSGGEAGRLRRTRQPTRCPSPAVARKPPISGKQPIRTRSCQAEGPAKGQGQKLGGSLPSFSYAAFSTSLTSSFIPRTFSASLLSCVISSAVSSTCSSCIRSSLNAPTTTPSPCLRHRLDTYLGRHPQRRTAMLWHQRTPTICRCILA